MTSPSDASGIPANDAPHTPTDPGNSAAAHTQTADLPDDLPPVQPPSAGFIFQLFVIPALIVASIIGVYTLFGKLGSSEQDWRKLVAELRNSNEHRRWRAALGLAQMLRGDHELPADQRKLTNNPQVGRAMVDLYREVQQTRNTSSDKDKSYRVFLCTTLGLLDLPDLVLPPLRETMLDSNEAEEVRNAAISSVALLLGRLTYTSKDQTIPGETAAADDALLQDCIALSQVDNTTLRKLATYTIALFPQPQAANRLEVLLNDSDKDVRANAAVGLARQGSPAGWPVLRDLLQSAADQPVAAQAPADPGEEAGRHSAVKSSLKAVGMLAKADKWTPEQTGTLLTLVGKIGNSHPDARIRTDALATLQQLQGKN